MPNKFTAYHNPPIESLLKRAIYLGGIEDEQRMWRVMHHFTEGGALPDASYGLLLIGANSAVWHHSTSENIEGKMSAVCSLPGSPFVFVCDAAAIEPRPFGQQVRDHMVNELKKHGLRTCPECKGAGKVERPKDPPASPNQVPAVPHIAGIETCKSCGGEGVVRIEPEKEKKGPAPAPKVTPKAPVASKNIKTKGQKIKRVNEETGCAYNKCQEALDACGWDIERAIEWLDDKRKRNEL